MLAHSSRKARMHATAIGRYLRRPVCITLKKSDPDSATRPVRDTDTRPAATNSGTPTQPIGCDMIRGSNIAR
jgi:hypothetical protein